MKLSFLFNLLLTCLLTGATALAQKSCQFDIVGTWQMAESNPENPPNLLSFARNGISTTFFHDTSGRGSEWTAGSRSKYSLDNPTGPRTLRFTPLKRANRETGRVEYLITQYDDGSFTTGIQVGGDTELTRWIRVDAQHYYIVFAAGKGTPDFGAAAFAMLVRTDGHETQTDSFGLYPVNQHGQTVVLGDVPEDVRRSFAKEAPDDSAAILRLQLAAGAYHRALQVMKTWERRVSESTLPYSYPYLNNAVYIDEVAQSLTRCGGPIKMYELTWRYLDPINQRLDLPQVPYQNIKEFRRLNEDLHIRDEKFYQAARALNFPPQR